MGGLILGEHKQAQSCKIERKVCRRVSTFSIIHHTGKFPLYSCNDRGEMYKKHDAPAPVTFFYFPIAVAVGKRGTGPTAGG